MEIQSARYRKYSEHLKAKYGEKVHKVTVNLPLTCPNRDGKLSSGGCTFCGESGTDFDPISPHIAIEEQLHISKEIIKKKYKASKFIAYLQNYTNTYLPLSDFKKNVIAMCQEGIVELAISTRPDCLGAEYLDFLAQIKEERQVEITLELGLQSANYHTLLKVNRGHTLAQFIEAVLACSHRGLNTCAHMILNLPGDAMEDVIEGAKLLTALKVDQVKLHSLYILKGTSMADDYLAGKLKIISLSEYIDRVITFLEHLEKNIIVQRLIGQAPREQAIFANWSTSVWHIVSQIELELFQQNTWQGKEVKGQILVDNIGIIG